MHYVCLVYFDQNELFSLEGDEVETCIREAAEHDARLIQSGHMVIAHALAPTAEARTVRVRDGKASATDGPFAEAREVLGGLVIIEAKDMAEAEEIAAGIPLARRGAIEVRAALGPPSSGLQ